MTYIGHRTGVKSGLTTLENLRVMCALNGSAIGREERRDVWQRVGLGRQADMSARQLSMGQLRRVALARLIACPRALWLLDEVFWPPACLKNGTPVATRARATVEAGSSQD
jgi:heme exporter protein A